VEFKIEEVLLMLLEGRRGDIGPSASVYSCGGGCQSYASQLD
jgi:hypothetical protein